LSAYPRENVPDLLTNLLQFKNLAHFESTFISSQQKVCPRTNLLWSSLV
jgi:hypothetical protein